jgi:hypothetical protein
MNMQAGPLCRGYTPREQDAADTLVASNGAHLPVDMCACPSYRSDPTLADHDDDVVSGSKEPTGCCGFEGDPVADAVSCCRASCGGERDGVGVEGSDHVVWVGQREGDRQPAVATADDRHPPPGGRHRWLLWLAGNVQRVERIARDLVHLRVDEPRVGEHLEGELFPPGSAEPGAAVGQ